MQNHVSERRLTENEALLRSRNEKAKNMIGHLISKDEKIEFYCECSDLECRERIVLSGKTYEELHEEKRDFIIRKGHDDSNIEDVIGENGSFCVVRKHLEPEL